MPLDIYPNILNAIAYIPIISMTLHIYPLFQWHCIYTHYFNAIACIPIISIFIHVYQSHSPNSLWQYLVSFSTYSIPSIFFLPPSPQITISPIPSNLYTHSSLIGSMSGILLLMYKSVTGLILMARWNVRLVLETNPRRESERERVAKWIYSEYQ